MRSGRGRRAAASNSASQSAGIVSRWDLAIQEILAQGRIGSKAGFTQTGRERLRWSGLAGYQDAVFAAVVAEEFWVGQSGMSFREGHHLLALVEGDLHVEPAAG